MTPFSSLPELSAHFPTLAGAAGLLSAALIVWALQRQLKNK